MKKAIAVFILTASISYAYAQSIIIASDRDLDADFTSYKTFNFASQVDDKLDAGYFFLNDLLLKSEIRDAVKSELMGLGYKMETTEPDLIVNFRVFEKPVQLKGTEGYGTTFWGGEQYRDISDTTTYNVDAGTLLVSLVDRENGGIVWHGFASGLIDNDKFIKDEVKIREAVNLIFDEYGLRAKEYSRK
jgi:hypothetical protein